MIRKLVIFLTVPLLLLAQWFPCAHLHADMSFWEVLDHAASHEHRHSHQHDGVRDSSALHDNDCWPVDQPGESPRHQHDDDVSFLTFRSGFRDRSEPVDVGSLHRASAAFAPASALELHVMHAPPHRVERPPVGRNSVPIFGRTQTLRL